MTSAHRSDSSGMACHSVRKWKPSCTTHSLGKFEAAASDMTSFMQSYGPFCVFQQGVTEGKVCFQFSYTGRVLDKDESIALTVGRCAFGSSIERKKRLREERSWNGRRHDFGEGRLARGHLLSRSGWKMAGRWRALSSSVGATTGTRQHVRSLQTL